MDEVPPIFRIVRCTRDKNVYQDLKNRVLSVEEKIWLCREVDGLNKEREDQIRSKKGLIRRYHLYKNFFTHNYKRYQAGSLSTKGRLYGISNDQIKIITDKIAIARCNQAPLDSNELKDLINKGYVETSIERGKVNPEFEGIQPRTFKNLCAREGITLHSPGAIQEAQIAACKDPFMSYHWYLICLALSDILPATNKFNIDATTYVFEEKGKGAKAASLLNIEDYKIDGYDTISLTKNSKEVKSSKTGSKLPFAIKNMMMINAHGEASKFVLIVAIKEMLETEWHVEEVRGLSISVSVGESG
jgi:hypothetical protein